MKKETKNTFWEDVWDIVKFTFFVLLVVIPIRIFIAQPFIVSGQSMLPTFHNGDYLIVDELSYRYKEPQRGEIVIFRLPTNPKRFLIKRIIGLPGETVEMQNGVVTITKKDGSKITLKEDYIREPFSSFGEWKLKDDEYFVMGDNRNNSSDSRTWGVLKKENLIGKTFLRLYPIQNIQYQPGTISLDTKTKTS